MKKNLFIGIDISKKWIDVSAFHASKPDVINYFQFDNNSKGFKALINWVESNHKLDKNEMLFCLENTGAYSLELCEYLTKDQYFVWEESPLQIKRSMGIKRAKNDKIDSLDIAKYAWRFQDKAKAYTIPSETLSDLKNLEALRRRLMKAKVSLEVASNELSNKGVNEFIKQKSADIIKELKQQIKDVDQKMKVLTTTDTEINKQYKLCVSVPGIGPQTAIHLLIYTRCFTGFETVRQLACYCGLAPFEQTSGSSIRSKSKVSHLANKKLKSLLNTGATSLLYHNEETKQYYERKLKEGKTHNCIMNVIRYKIVNRVFAVIKRGTGFMDSLKYEAYKKAA